MMISDIVCGRKSKIIPPFKCIIERRQTYTCKMYGIQNLKRKNIEKSKYGTHLYLNEATKTFVFS